jgi:peroxiredoxin
MQPALATQNIQVVALSKDDVAAATIHKSRDALTVTLLSDPELEVIKLYGVEHHKAVNFTTGKRTLFGIPIAFKPSIKSMAIPTTLLIDENGTIQWIDQSEDYRVRSDDRRVRDAIEQAFPAGS